MATLFTVGCADPATDDPSAAEMQEEPEEIPEEIPADKCPTPTWDGTFEVGYGDTCFSPITDDLAVPLIAGRQGGYHVWLGVRCRGCGFYETVNYGARDTETDAALAPVQGSVLQLDDAGDYTQAYGLTALVNVGGEGEPASPQEMIGRRVTLFAEVELGPDVFTSEVSVTISSVEQQSSSCPDCN